MKKVKLADNLTISRLVHGHWRLNEWKMTSKEILALTRKLLELGITTFDHANIYGNYRCEEQFGRALSLDKEVRKKLQIVTKCGIKLISDKFPDRQTQHYDYSREHIINSVNRSLKNFRTDYIDLLLLHRPSPFFNPSEVAQAFTELQQSGKVLQFGVSNFTPGQYEMLYKHFNGKLVTNQVEISPYCLEHFENGNIDFFLKEAIKPMAWSPLAGGRILNPRTKHEHTINNTLKNIADELNTASIEEVIYAWLLQHPAQIIPIIGSGKLSRIYLAVKALKTKMTLEQWFQIYIAATGKPLP